LLADSRQSATFVQPTASQVSVKHAGVCGKGCRPGLAWQYPQLIDPVREALEANGKPYVIENVEGARDHMREPVVLCGFMFGREMYRHRLFEAGGGLVLADPPMSSEEMPGRRKTCGWPHPVPTARAGHWEPGKFVSVSGHERRGPVNAAMDIDWMTRREDVAEAIPPCFTQWIGAQTLSGPESR
jgi:DNA (cytosine-5)-methyltransferase 1